MSIYWIKFFVNILVWVAAWIVMHTKIMSFEEYFDGDEFTTGLFIATLVATCIFAFIPYARVLPFAINIIAIIVMFNIDRVKAGFNWFMALGKKDED